MRSHVTQRFRECFAELPGPVRERARKTYRFFLQDPSHPSLRFKQVHPTEPIVSVRVGLGYRAVGVRKGDDIVWFWIGSHAEYDRLVR